jgi:hypothetical protein
MARPEQLFLGCPFQTRVRRNYDRLKAELEAETPLRVVLADTASITSSDDLLEHITTLIRESAACLFDATGANPNVSLEVGLAHALPTDFLLTISTRQPHPLRGAKRDPLQGTKRDPRKNGRTAAGLQRLIPPAYEARRSASPSGMRSAIPSGMRGAIIADLQGRNRIEYKTYRSLKDQVLRRYLAGLPYLKRWHEFEKNYRSYAPLALAVLHEIRASGRTSRPRLDAILSASGISVTALTRALTRHRLVSIRAGRDGGYVYPSR